MTAASPPLPEWERLLAAERHLQQLVPGGVTASALHAGHRTSHDADHVLEDLRERFDEVVATHESVAGWRPERVQRPMLVIALLALGGSQ